MSACVIIVPDTNVLLHSQLLDQIPWCDLTRSQSVEIVLVSQVLRELDAKKSGDSEKLRRRAQHVLSAIKRWMPSVSSVGTVGKGATIRVQVREPQPIEGLDLNVPDDRVIASAILLRGESPVVIASGDITMGYKAEMHGIDVLTIPDQYRIHDDAPQKKAAPSAPRPRLVASLFPPNDAPPAPNVEVRCGLTAGHLLPEAEVGLTLARRREAEVARARATEESARRAARALSSRGGDPRLRNPFSIPFSNTLAALDRITGPFDPPDEEEPSAEEWEQYIASLKNYDELYPNTFALSIGLINEGDAPADDILVEFWFPDGFAISDYEPKIPTKPLRRRLLIDDCLLRAVLAPSERNSSLRLDQHEDGTLMHLKIKRLMHSMHIAYPVWATVFDPSVRGMKINARVLSASPPTEAEVDLNVRWT